MRTPVWFVKIVGIDHDTGIHRVGLGRFDTDSVGDVLQNFRNHLTRGRGVRLYVRKHRIVDDLTALTVMIQNHNGLDQLKKAPVHR